MVLSVGRTGPSRTRSRTQLEPRVPQIWRLPEGEDLAAGTTRNTETDGFDTPVLRIMQEAGTVGTVPGSDTCSQDFQDFPGNDLGRVMLSAPTLPEGRNSSIQLSLDRRC